MKKVKISYLFAVFLGLICVLNWLIRLPSFSFPLDYDVGGHLFYGMEVATKGFYSTLQEIRPVGILAIYAVIYRLFGSSTIAVNIVGALFWTFSTLILHGITYLLFDSAKIAFFSSFFFVLLSSSRALQGEMVNIEAFFIPFSLLGIYLFLFSKKIEKRVFLVLSGFSFSLAFLTKHLAVFDWLPVLCFNFLLICDFRPCFANLIRKIKWLSVETSLETFGLLLPIVLVSLVFFVFGKFHDFFYYQFARIYGNVSGYGYLGSPLVNLRNNFLPIFAKTYPVWIFALLGIIFPSGFKDRQRRYFLFIWTISVFGGMYYLWWFFPHHFLQLAPPASILAGLFLANLYDKFKGKISGSSLSWGTGTIFFVIILLYLKADFNYFGGYLEKIKGKISHEQYLGRTGFELPPDGWLPFIKTAKYLKESTQKDEVIFVWGSLPYIYALSERQPASWFVYKFPFLPPELRHRTYSKIQFEVEESKKKLMAELLSSFPKFIVLEIDYEKIFDEMISFLEFRNFVYQNYEFDKQIGRVLVYQKKNIGAPENFGQNLPIPLEIVKRFAAIAAISAQNGKKIVDFEPMVNPSGLLRQYKISYPITEKIDFEQLTIEFLGQDGKDYVGLGTYSPSGTIDLHLKIESGIKQLSFIRVKTDNMIWNNRSYGVNPSLKVIYSSGAIDLFFEPVSDWRGKLFSVYFIYEDGSLAKGEIVGK